MTDLGLSHLALAVSDLSRSLAFYESWADMHPVHLRDKVAWISDGSRPFALVLAETTTIAPLKPFSHLGFAVDSRERVIELAARAERSGILLEGPVESGPPVGTWCFIADPDGHTVEFSFGQEVERTIDAPRTASRGRLPSVAVIGSGVDAHESLAVPLGRQLAVMNLDLVCGGGGGVMEAVARGFASVPHRVGRITGILPAGELPGYPNPWIENVVRTHLPARGVEGTDERSRNHIVVLSGDVVIALPGGAGTRSERELAVTYRRPLIEMVNSSDLEQLRGLLAKHLHA